VWECASDKTPRLDGINEFWEVIKADVLRFMDEFFANRVFLKGNNASFLALIHKVHDP